MPPPSHRRYAFPPFSVGEVGRNGMPGRREVGHGNLAERALRPAVPSEADFPYVLRLESLITESCGSSSMASVCGGCLAMRAAGVPVERMVAGVAMGMLLDETVSASTPPLRGPVTWLSPSPGPRHVVSPSRG